VSNPKIKYFEKTEHFLSKSGETSLTVVLKNYFKISSLECHMSLLYTWLRFYCKYLT